MLIKIIHYNVAMIHSTHYRDDPEHTPKDANGNLIPGGPWVRVGLYPYTQSGRYI